MPILLVVPHRSLLSFGQRARIVICAAIAKCQILKRWSEKSIELVKSYSLSIKVARALYKSRGTLLI